MKHHKLKNMFNGWFIGEFSPAAFKSEACEVAVKHYSAGDCEKAHYHKVATEVTLVLKGEVEMMDSLWVAGDIIVLEPGDVSAFKAKTDCSTVVVKVPGVLDDKYILEDAAG